MIIFRDINKHVRIRALTQCAGQECPERQGCARFENRDVRGNWASLDLERKLTGTCVHRKAAA